MKRQAEGLGSDGAGYDQLLLLVFVLFNHTALKLYSLWHVGYLLDDFYGFDVCSRVNLKLYNSARRPAFIKAPRLSGSLPSYWFSPVATTTGPSSPVLSIIPLSFSR